VAASKKKALGGDARRAVQPGIFKKFGCKAVAYEFATPLESFDLSLFRAEARLPDALAKWSSVCAPKNRLTTDYHVHLDGQIRPKDLSCRVYYVEGAIRPAADEKEPYAESIISWFGKFFKLGKAEVKVHAWFEQPDDRWRGRFNLPFKVTMAKPDTEVVINGISISLQDRETGAYEGTLKKEPGILSASVKLNRTVEFETFRLRDEIKLFNDVIKLWVEEVGT
jgi:hypothetical protein